MIDRTASVRHLDAIDWVPRQLALNAVDEGREVCLQWSERTGELFTCEVRSGEPDRLVDVLGRMESYEQADRLLTASRVPLPRGGGLITLEWLRAQLAALE